jgi:uncharacterized protein (DUF58 family)
MFETKTPSSISAPLLDPAILAEARRLELRTKRAIDADTVGNFRSSFKGSGLSFAELREYEPGDDIRRIDWKASARSNRTYAKSYIEERSLSIVLALDCSSSTQFGLGELRTQKTPHQLALSFAALITLIARHAGDAVGLLKFSDCIEDFIAPARKRSQIQRVLNSVLNERTNTASTDINAALIGLTTRLKRRSLIFIISDFFTPPFQENLRALSARHDVICAQISSAETASLPDVGIVEFKDAESEERIIIDTGSVDGRNSLKARLTKHSDETRRTCITSGAEWLALKENPVVAIRELMARRNRRLK